MRRPVFFLLGVLATFSVAMGGTLSLLHVGSPTVATVSATLVQPVFSTFQPPSSGTVTEFGAAGGSFGAAETSPLNGSSIPRRFPIPFHAKISNLNTYLTTANPNVTIVDRLDYVPTITGTVGCAYTSQNCVDNFHTDTVQAGTLMQWMWVPNGTWAQTAPSQVSFLLTSLDGQYVALIGQPNNSSGINSGTNFYGVGAAAPAQANTVLGEQTTSFMFCNTSCQGTLLGLYVTPNVTETTVGGQSWTVMHNGVATAMTCTTNNAPAGGGGGASGCCVDLTGLPGRSIAGGTALNPCTTTGSPITIVGSDTVSIKGVGTASAATAFPGFALIFAPSTSGVVPLSSQGGVPSSATEYFGLSTFQANGTQSGFHIIPASMTFSDYQECTLTALSGANTKTASLQVSAGQPTLPTTPGGGPTVTIAVGNACPGSQSATWLGGKEDVTHTLAATTGQLLDTAMTSSANTGSVAGKIAMAVTVAIPIVTSSGSSSFVPLIDMFSPPAPGALQ